MTPTFVKHLAPLRGAGQTVRYWSPQQYCQTGVNITLRDPRSTKVSHDLGHHSQEMSEADLHEGIWPAEFQTLPEFRPGSVHGLWEGRVAPVWICEELVFSPIWAFNNGCAGATLKACYWQFHPWFWGLTLGLSMCILKRSFSESAELTLNILERNTMEFLLHRMSTWVYCKECTGPVWLLGAEYTRVTTGCRGHTWETGAITHLRISTTDMAELSRNVDVSSVE